MSTSFTVREGKILLYHLFDVADSISLEHFRQNWMGESTLIKLVSRRAAPYYLQFGTSPLLLPLGRKPLQIRPDQPEIDAEVNIKVFEFGVVSICWEIPMPALWDEAVKDALHFIDNFMIEEQSRELLKTIRPVMEPSLDKPYEEALIEDYTIFYVKHFEGHKPNAEVVLEQLGPDIASMLRGESKPLSKAERELILGQRLSYFEDDLVVLAWNSAFIYDPESSNEHVDMLEFANAELLELRSYDSLLDRELKQIYHVIEQQTPGKWVVPIFSNPYQEATQKLMTLVLDVLELTDKIENSLKIIGELYSARVYRLMSSVLRLNEWQNRVDGKLNNARQIFDTLNHEVQNRRSTLLEITIILLIAFEIVLFIFPMIFPAMPKH